MNYYQARQMKSSGKWHYTCMNDDRIWPVGYCGLYQTCPKCKGNYATYTSQPITKEACDKIGIEFCEICKNAGTIKAETPCPGHDTAEEACEHYRQYQLDNVRFNKNANEQHKCVICDKWTQTYAMVDGYTTFDVCEEHANKESLATVYQAQTCCMSS